MTSSHKVKSMMKWMNIFNKTSFQYSYYDRQTVGSFMGPCHRRWASLDSTRAVPIYYSLPGILVTHVRAKGAREKYYSVTDKHDVLDLFFVTVSSVSVNNWSMTDECGLDVDIYRVAVCCCKRIWFSLINSRLFSLRLLVVNWLSYDFIM